MSLPRLPRRALPWLAALALLPFAAAAQPALEVLPAGTLYRPYLADPQESQVSVALMDVSAPDIPDSGNNRFGLRLGGHLGLLRGQVAAGQWQLSLEAGFAGQFDNDANQDSIGWDGKYGLALEWRTNPRFSSRLFALHTSAHLGDEYIERTGHPRINYTREELGVALSWHPNAWRTYAEAAWAFDLRNDELQAPWRGQLGVEYQRPGTLWGGRLGWYAALDVNAYEERDWRGDTAAALGLMLPGTASTLRLDLYYEDGRPLTGEFFHHTEQSLSLRLSANL